MKYMKKMILVFMMCLMMVACGQKSQTIHLEKDGNIHEIADQVSFYYPKDFAIDTANDNTEILQLVLDEEVFNYITEKDDTDNAVEDMPELYAGQLEEDGASDVQYYSKKLESGIECQVFTGRFLATGMKFKHIVYFTDQYVYDYSYQAPEEIYDDCIAARTQYLESLTVHH